MMLRWMIRWLDWAFASMVAVLEDSILLKGVVEGVKGEMG